LSLPQNPPTTPQDTRPSNQKACDDKIAGISGGPGAVAATVAEPWAASESQLPQCSFVGARQRTVSYICVYASPGCLKAGRATLFESGRHTATRQSRRRDSRTVLPDLDNRIHLQTGIIPLCRQRIF
jgi:hypothetical protein